MNEYPISYLFKILYYYFIQSCKDAYLLVVKLPIRMVWAVIELDRREIIPYWYSILHDHLYRVEKNKLTIHFEIIDAVYRIRTSTYDSEMQELVEKFHSKEFHDLNTLIDEALPLLKVARYMIIEKDSVGSKFIQFSYNQGTYCLDFPVTPLSKNFEYKEKIIHYLQSHGFTQFKRIKTIAFIYKTYTQIHVSEDLDILTANFGNDEELMKRSIKDIYRKIFQETDMPIVHFIYN